MTQKAEFCDFCQILNKKEVRTNRLIASNQEFFAFHDLNIASAQAHLLVCTKQHLESVFHITDITQLFRMKTYALTLMKTLFMKQLSNNQVEASFRFGFHLPPHISVDHVHMHCFLLPLSNYYLDRVQYGANLKSVEEVASMLTVKTAKI